MWMVDWLSFKVELDTRRYVHGGSFVTLNEGGGITSIIDKRRVLRGSFDETLTVRCLGTTLEISGNPAKWFQGHNLFGSNDVGGLARCLCDTVCRAVGIELSGNERAALGGRIALTRIDCTRMYQLPAGMVPTWLNLAGTVAHGGHQSIRAVGSDIGRTVYVGMNSRRISTKFYDKTAELRRHPPLLALRLRDEWEQLAAWAADMLRVEVALRSMELRDRRLTMVSAWSSDVGDAILDERITGLSMLDNIELVPSDEVELPGRLLGPYLAWRDGYDIRTLYSRATRFRYRRELKAYGIDIFVPRFVPKDMSLTTAQMAPMGRPLSSFLVSPAKPPQALIERFQFNPAA